MQAGSSYWTSPSIFAALFGQGVNGVLSSRQMGNKLTLSLNQARLPDAAFWDSAFDECFAEL